MSWQPIETAPKDGSAILVGSVYGEGAWIAGWQPFAVSGYKFACPWRSKMLNHDHIPPKDRHLAPTHWQPLPEPPENTP